MKTAGISAPPYMNSFQSIDRDLSKAQSFAQTLDKVSGKVTGQDDKKLYESCQDLESIFMSSILNSMRATITRSELLPRGLADDVYESMLYDEYAKDISKTGSMGLADIIYQQLKQSSK
jgi:flagellar protein FlgJ